MNSAIFGQSCSSLANCNTVRVTVTVRIWVKVRARVSVTFRVRVTLWLGLRNWPNAQRVWSNTQIDQMHLTLTLSYSSLW